MNCAARIKVLVLFLLAAAHLFAQAPGKPRTIEFSGLRWVVKQSPTPVGPGRNYFSGRGEDVWVDKEGKLHLTIAQHDGKWWSTEVYTEKSLGYGTYTYTVEGRPDRLDKNAVFGLFTWANSTFKSDANSEIDVEFARWGDPAQKILQYSVHPTRGPDLPDRGIYRERFFEEEVKIESGVSTHRIVWTPESVRVSSFDGARPLAEWACEGKPPRRAKDGGQISEPIGIPRPGRDTRAHVNLWQVDSDGDGLGEPPSDGREVEIVVEKFEFVPAGK